MDYLPCASLYRAVLNITTTTRFKGVTLFLIFFFQVEKIAASEHVVGLEEDDVQQDLPPSGLSSPMGIT